MMVADVEYTDIGILHIIEVVDFHRDPSHDVWPILNLALVSLDPKSEPNIDSEMEPEDGPLYSFKWDTDNRASQNVTIRTTDTQNCGSRAIEKNSSSATVLEVIFENNCSSALWTQPFIHFLMTMVHPRASIGDAGTRGAARAARASSLACIASSSSSSSSSSRACRRLKDFHRRTAPRHL
jgi:hypothetical protein